MYEEIMIKINSDIYLPSLLMYTSSHDINFKYRMDHLQITSKLIISVSMVRITGQPFGILLGGNKSLVFKNCCNVYVVSVIGVSRIILGELNVSFKVTLFLQNRCCSVRFTILSILINRLWGTTGICSLRCLNYTKNW